MSTSTSRPHPLLRGGRWRLARPRSRALWTTATAAELAELFADPRLRRGTEAFLRQVASAVDDVETLLLFDDDCTQLAVAITLPGAGQTGFRWDWIGHSLAAPRATTPYDRPQAEALRDPGR